MPAHRNDRLCQYFSRLASNIFDPNEPDTFDKIYCWFHGKIDKKIHGKADILDKILEKSAKAKYQSGTAPNQWKRKAPSAFQNADPAVTQKLFEYIGENLAGWYIMRLSRFGKYKDVDRIYYLKPRLDINSPMENLEKVISPFKRYAIELRPRNSEIENLYVDQNNFLRNMVRNACDNYIILYIEDLFALCFYWKFSPDPKSNTGKQIMQKGVHRALGTSGTGSDLYAELCSLAYDIGEEQSRRFVGAVNATKRIVINLRKQVTENPLYKDEHEFYNPLYKPPSPELKIGGHRKKP